MSLHRRAAKRDDAEAGVVAMLRALGASVVRISGENVPDLLVGWRHTTYLAEVKTGRAKLKPGQRQFASTWNGHPVPVLRTPQDAQAWLLGLAGGRVVIGGRGRSPDAPQGKPGALANGWHEAEENGQGAERESSAGGMERVKG